MNQNFEKCAMPAPTAEQIATRDRLAEELALTPPKSLARRFAERELVAHMFDVWTFPQDHFTTASGQAFDRNVSITKVKMIPGQEKQARAFLNGRNAESVARKLVLKGGCMPTELFEEVSLNIRIKPARPRKVKSRRPGGARRV